MLEGHFSDGTVSDKILLIGPTAVGIYDLQVTPFTGKNLLAFHCRVLERSTVPAVHA
jgi:CHASE2 domain-containing sensor protein